MQVWGPISLIIDNFGRRWVVKYRPNHRGNAMTVTYLNVSSATRL